MQYTHIFDEDGRNVKSFPQPDTSYEKHGMIVATLLEYYADLERDLDRRILTKINPLLFTRVIQLYVAKVTVVTCDHVFLLTTIIQGPYSWGH
jgi:hypothetical protein